MNTRHRAAPETERHGRPPLRHSAGRRPRRAGSTKAGLLGLGGYGVGLSAIGVVSLAGPLVAVAAGAGPVGSGGLAELVGGAAAPAARPAGEALDPGRQLAPSVPVLGGSSAAGGDLPQARQGETPRRQEAFRPVRLLLPEGSSAPVLPAGLNTDGTLAVPEMPTQLGWWTGGARAGDPFGSMVIAGHVDSYRYGLGALHRLGKIKKGAVIEARAGTQKMRYRVTSVGSIPKARLAGDTTAFRQDIGHRLILITCGGAFDQVARSYAENIVVVAAPIP